MDLLLDGNFLLTFDFVWKMTLINTLNNVLLLIMKIEYCICASPSYAKLLKQNNFFSRTIQ